MLIIFSFTCGIITDIRHMIEITNLDLVAGGTGRIGGVVNHYERFNHVRINDNGNVYNSYAGYCGENASASELSLLYVLVDGVFVPYKINSLLSRENSTLFQIYMNDWALIAERCLARDGLPFTPYESIKDKDMYLQTDIRVVN